MDQSIELFSKLQNPLDAISQIGEMFAKSGMFGCDRKEQGQVLAMVCITERKSPVQILREHHIIEGRLSDRADSMLAKFRQSGGKHKVIRRDADEAAVELTKDGQSMVFRLTFEEVKAEPFVRNKEGGFKKNWNTPRMRMQTLWARVISDGVRTMAPEIVAGVYTPEEIIDDTPGGASAPAPEIKLATPAPEPTAQPPAPQARAVEVVVEPAPTRQPTPTPAPQPTAQPTVQPAPQAADGKLPAEMVDKLEALIGEDSLNAHNWMLKNKWIQPGQTHENLSVKNAERILKQGDSFKRVIRGGQ